MFSSSRRRFIHSLAVGGVGAAGGFVLPSFLTSKNALASAREHRPQTYVEFPAQRKWFPEGRYERYPLWPYPHDEATFSLAPAEWTAFYRYTNKSSACLIKSTGFYQIFVCSGQIEVTSVMGERIPHRLYRPGDFFCQWFHDDELASFAADTGTTLIVKRQQYIVESDYEPREVRASDNSFISLPFLFPSRDRSGFPFEVNSSFLLGNALRRLPPGNDMTALTLLEYFHDETIAPSHYHEGQVWHEFIYLQGGHLTPDGYYGTGDFIASMPLCKEGPYMARIENTGTYPREWPMYADISRIQRDPLPPWPRPFHGGLEGVYGILFVHHGPFARITPTRLANWTTLDPYELGPEG